MTIDTKEHLYHDDPASGHPDVRTRLRGASYSFVGNGLVLGAVQSAPEGEGSPYGLIVQDPDRLLAKRGAPTFDAATGLERTMLSIALDGGEGASTKAEPPDVRWDDASPIPTVLVSRRCGPVAVEERFSCPDADTPAVVRVIRLLNRGAARVEARISTGVRSTTMERVAALDPGDSATFCLRYRLDAEHDAVAMEPALCAPPDEETLRRSRGTTRLSTGDAFFDHLVRSAADQLPAVPSARGRIDAGIWQYTREWVRDQAFMAQGMLLAGRPERAATVLGRLLREFITDDGSALDSSERRADGEAELDQNGALLAAVRDYLRWTGDDDFARANWAKIRATADFPMRPVFRHAPSGLLMNARDFWERHSAYGIELGMELAHQVFVTLGWEAAAEIARDLGERGDAERWSEAAVELRRATLEDPAFGLVDHGRLVKRRGPDGRVQAAIRPRIPGLVPEGSRLAIEGIPHPLDPDSAAALAIAWGFLDPRSPVAAETMRDLEGLWNQGWSDGGYGRYHMDSDPDSPGAWPFVSLYIARAYLAMDRPEMARRVLDWMATIPGAAAGSWFEMMGARVSPPYAQVGVVPWVWAEAILLGVRDVLGVRPGADGIVLRPRLVTGMDEVEGRVTVRGRSLSVRVRRAAKGGRPSIQAGGIPAAIIGPGVFRVPDSASDLEVEIELPTV